MADLLMKMPVPYEPKRSNRFILRFDSTLGINEWFVESTGRPSIDINPVEIPFLNTSTFVDSNGIQLTSSSVIQSDHQQHKLLWSGYVYTLNL